MFPVGIGLHGRGPTAPSRFRPTVDTSGGLSVPGILQGKTIIVTGAGGGIGREASIVLAHAGANVVVTAIAAERDVGNDNVGSGVGQHNGRLTAYAAAGTGDDDGLTLQDPGHGQSPRSVHRGTEP